MKNCVIILAATATALLLSSCTLNFAAKTATQNYSGSVTIYRVPEVEDWKK